MSLRPSSQQLSRSQMLGMIATLRGAVYSLILTDPSDRDEEVADAKRILDETAGDADEEDLVDGSFDMSWSPRHQDGPVARYERFWNSMPWHQRLGHRIWWRAATIWAALRGVPTPAEERILGAWRSERADLEARRHP